MTDLRQRLIEDRMLRDSAKRLVQNDVAYLKGDVADRGVGARMADRMREGAEGLVDDARSFASENPASVGSGFALVAGLAAAWLFRDEIAEGLERLTRK